MHIDSSLTEVFIWVLFCVTGPEYQVHCTALGGTLFTFNGAKPVIKQAILRRRPSVNSLKQMLDCTEPFWCLLLLWIFWHLDYWNLVYYHLDNWYLDDWHLDYWHLVYWRLDYYTGLLMSRLLTCSQKRFFIQWIGPGARPLNLALPICTYTRTVSTQINQVRFWGFCP